MKGGVSRVVGACEAWSPEEAVAVGWQRVAQKDRAGPCSGSPGGWSVRWLPVPRGAMWDGPPDFPKCGCTFLFLLCSGPACGGGAPGSQKPHVNAGSAHAAF